MAEPAEELRRNLSALRLTRVLLRTCWISANDYPRQLAAADAGLSLHRSASGVDLPMKLADLLGAGLPVFALSYGTCLDERFVSGVHGWTFASAEELSRRLAELARPGGRELLERQAHSIRRRPADLWDDAWNRDLRPFFRSLVAEKQVGRR